MRLKAKLLFAYSTVVVITLGMAFFGYWHVQKLGKALYEIGVVRLPGLEGLNMMQNAWTALANSERVVLLPDLNEPTFSAELDRGQKAWALLDKGWRLYAPLPQTTEAARVWRAFAPKAKAWKYSYDALISLVRESRRTGNKRLPAKTLEAYQAAITGQSSEVRTLLDNLTEINDQLADAAKARTPGSYRTMVRTDNLMLFAIGASVLCAIGCGIFLHRRIGTALAQMAEELRWRTAFLDAQVNASPDAVLVLDHQGKKLLQNKLMTEIWKIPRDIADDPDDRKQLKFATNQVKNPESFLERIKFINAHPDEITRDEVELKDGRVFDRYSSPVLDKDRTNYGRIWVFRDITQKKLAEQALRLSEEKFSKAFRLSPDIISISDLETGAYIEVNDSHQDIFGQPKQNIIGHTPPELNIIEEPEVFNQSLQYLREHGHIRNMELLARNRDGKLITMLLSAEVIEFGGRKCILRVSRDITERKEFERRLIESETRFRNYFEQPLTGVAITSPEKGWLAVNDRFCELLGYSREELYQTDWPKLTHPEDLAADLREFNRVLSGQIENYTLDKRFIRKDGKIIWTIIAVGCVRKADRSVDYICGSMQDITERKLAAEALQASETRFRRLIEQAPLAISISRMTEMLYVNQKFLDLYGFKNIGEIRQTSIPELWAPEFRELVAERIQKRARGEQVPSAYEGIARRKDGAQFPVEVVVGRVDLPDGPASLAFISDITRRKKRELEIGRLNRLYDVLSHINQAIVRESTCDQLFQAICRVVIEHGGFRMAWIGWHNADTSQLVPVASFGDESGYLQTIKVYTDDRPEGHGPTGTAFREDRPYVCNNLAEDPTALPWRKALQQLNFRASAVFPIKQQGKSCGTLTVYADETDFFQEKEINLLKEATTDISFALDNFAREEELQRATETQRNLAAIVNSSDDAIIGKTLQGFITSWNPGAEKVFGYSAAEAIGQSILMLFPPERLGEETEFMTRINRRESVRHFETERVRKDSRRIYVSVTLSPITDAGGKVIGVSDIARNITERRVLEQQFRQAQKMEAFGQLAGGVAHDFNNILAVIQLQAGMLKQTPGIAEAGATFADEIEAAAGQGAALTRQLLLFSRKQNVEMRDLELNGCVENIARLLRRALGENVQIEFKYNQKKLFVRADAGMLDQVLMNLTVNSRDAMPQGGQLTVETSSVEFDKADAAQSPKIRPGSFACLSVSDTGTGISPENLQHIFEPFFTTKEVGKGTGLGLATVFGIVQQHQGWIDLQSEVARGTTFRIYLPRLVKPAKANGGTTATTNTPGGNETIMLVEDDPSVRAAVGKSLLTLGYRVLHARSGIEAMAIWHQNMHEIRLVLTDIVMPGGISGIDLAKQLLEDDPKVKVIYMCGYSAEIARQNSAMEEGVNFLQKPFESAKLAQIIRASLDA